MYATRPRCLAHAAGRAGAKRRFPRGSFSFGRSSPDADAGNASASAATRRRYATAANKGQPPRSIAVLGGGLTGLTTAWHLTRALPHARITLYEASDRLGGWIDTSTVNLRNRYGQEGPVHFERAARMVRPQTGGRVPRWDDLLFFDMVAHLNLTDQLMHASAEDSGTTAYIYYPNRLVPIPRISRAGPLRTLDSILDLVPALFQPVFRDVIPSALHNARTTGDPYTADILEGRSDVSVGDYFAYRFGRTGLVDKVFSAVTHGMTGGDVWKQSLASGSWADYLPRNDGEPVTRVRVRRADYALMNQLVRDKAVFDLATEHLDSGSLWFRNGMSTLTNALADALRKNPNVTIKMGDPVTSVRYLDNFDRVFITTKQNKKPVPYEKVVSTIYAKHLAALTDDHLPSLASSTAVSIMIVHLWYPDLRVHSPNTGFGYLLPQAVPHEANPECVLGVIFDSDREFPTTKLFSLTNLGADGVEGTKMTVLMGGHYWDGLPESFIPDPAAAADMARAAVQRHLRLSDRVARSAYAAAQLCRDCIPQLLVGHAARMRAAHAELQWAFRGRLAVAGQSYQPSGVLTMLRAGRDIAMQIAHSSSSSSSSGTAQRPPPLRGEEEEGEEEAAYADAAAADGYDDDWPVGDTGLERFTRQPTWLSVEKRLLPLRFKSGAYVDEDGNIQPGD
ncbi:2957ed3d-b889-4060-818b-25abf414d309 [Thermothielavioides terrestris]|uniref:2957ed3d-b889-4060-818b-25abf414d309 n=1 Tax=Thermothielavioides terrestris TaxID=2587410 RepID=A0A3S4AIL7_9PEZI|nr:2957ed3d-b889-4060-818b-25abf414d309 [Thermothielavioides terrestris]